MVAAVALAALAGGLFGPRLLATEDEVEARYRVIPTLAGTLHASASSLEGAGQRVYVPSGAWTIR